MDVTHDTGRAVVTKRARSAAERRQLANEADVLRVVAHPGVVQLVEVEGDEPPDGLVLRRVPGSALTQLGLQPAAVIAGLGAAIATTLADLHDLGIQHGAIEASHVLLDDQGRPVLCSFGRARRNLPRGLGDTYIREDVSALARLLLAQLERDAAPGVDRPLRRAAGTGRRSGDARWLARQLALRVPGARLPVLSVETDPSELGTAMSTETGAAPHLACHRHGRHHSRRPIRRTLLLWAGVGLLGLAAVTATRPWSLLPPARGRQLPCPQVDMGCGPVPTPAGVLTTATGRYLVGDPDDVVVLGRWRCGSIALPAVLRPETEELWAFVAWPTPGHGVPGQLVTNHLRGAWGLRVLVQASGCDRIEVERRGKPPLTEEPPR
jgi:hypothetical protein